MAMIFSVRLLLPEVSLFFFVILLILFGGFGRSDDDDFDVLLQVLVILLFSTIFGIDEVLESDAVDGRSAFVILASFVLLRDFVVDFLMIELVSFRAREKILDETCDQSDGESTGELHGSGGG